ncbi:MAG: tocopherol cyclase family protein, partial [Fervidobacterium sp.]
DGKEINFSNGRGYIEKDWGVGFPSAWIWFQSNHFSDCKFDKIYMDPAKISLTLSIAIVPFLKKKIKGFIVGLLLDDKLYKFTPYEGGILEKVLVDSKNVTISIKNNKHSMEIVINRTEQFGVLYAPDKEDMLPKVNESIFSKAVVNLYDNGNGKKLIFSGIARIGALELVGDIDKLITV